MDSRKNYTHRQHWYHYAENLPDREIISAIHSISYEGRKLDHSSKVIIASLRARILQTVAPEAGESIECAVANRLYRLVWDDCRVLYEQTSPKKEGAWRDDC